MSEKFHGLVLVDKPSGITSHDVVSRLRRILGTKAIGHSGTLDPLASGLMVCLVNEGTKLSQYILEGDKSYRVRAQFGIKTDTLDTTGQILETHEVKISEAEILKAADSLMGEFSFPVPIYSAIKVQGKKLYDYARSEEEVKIPLKVMKFYDLKFLGSGADWAEFELKCSKGSYIRTWVDELGNALGCGAAMSSLRRIWSNPYTIEQALSFESLEAQIKKSGTAESFVAMAQALPNTAKVKIKGHDAVLLRNGQISHDLRVLLIGAFKLDQPQSVIQVISQENDLVLALIGVEPEKGFVIRRVFHYS